METKYSRVMYQLQSQILKLVQTYKHLYQTYPPLRWASYVLSSLVTLPVIAVTAAMAASLAALVMISTVLIGIIQTGVIALGTTVLFFFVALAVVTTAFLALIFIGLWMVYVRLKSMLYVLKQ